MIIIMHFLPLLTRIGSVAEWSKALVLGTSLYGGVGSNPTAAKKLFFVQAQAELQSRKKYLPRVRIELTAFRL